MATVLEDCPAEIFFCIFDYFWAHELFYAFANLNSRIDAIVSNAQLHILSEKQDIIYSPDRVASLSLTTSPECLDDFTNLHSLTLTRCNLDNLVRLPPSLLRLCIRSTDLPPSNVKLIFECSTLANVHLNLLRKLNFSPSTVSTGKSHSNIEYLTISYISLNDIIELLQHTPKLKYLHISLYGINKQQITNHCCVPTVTRLVCLSMGISFDVLCSQFLSVYFPSLQSLSVFTSYVDQNLFINSLEQLLLNELRSVKKLNISAQFIINRPSADGNDNIESISTRFRTAFWIKRNCRATFKYSHDGSHVIRVYLQTNKRPRARPSRFLV